MESVIVLLIKDIFSGTSSLMDLHANCPPDIRGTPNMAGLASESETFLTTPNVAVSAVYVAFVPF
jgi:hypothetical protein